VVVLAMLQAMYDGVYLEAEAKKEYVDNPLVFHAKVRTFSDFRKIHNQSTN